MKIRKPKKKETSDNLLFKNLFEIGKSLLAESSVDDLLSLAIDKAIELSNAERGMIILFGNGEEILFQAARNLDKKDIENPKFEVSRSIIKAVKKNKEAIYLENALEDPTFRKSDSVLELRILSVICLPLIHQKEIFGVVYLDNRKLCGVFTQETYEFIHTFSDFISLAAYNALDKKHLKNGIQALESELRNKYELKAIIGSHAKMLEIYKLVSQVADTDAIVLIQG